MPSGFVDGAAEWIVMPVTELGQTKDRGRNGGSGKVKVKSFVFFKNLNDNCFIMKIRTKGVYSNSPLYLPIF